MHKVLTDEELVQIEPLFDKFCRDRRLTVHDELFRVIRMLLISSDDARTALVAYLAVQAATVDTKNWAASLVDGGVVEHRDEWAEIHGSLRR